MPNHTTPHHTTAASLIHKTDNIENDRAALGEVRNGEGTSGYMPPEAMLGMKVKSHSNQEVFSFAHLLWLTFSKQEFKQYNMFLGKVRNPQAALETPLYVARPSVLAEMYPCNSNHVAFVGLLAEHIGAFRICDD